MTVPSFCMNHPSSKYNASKYNAVLSTHSGYSLPFTQMLRGLSESPLISIAILLFCSKGITLVARIHPYPALFHHRDYFHRSDASLSAFSAPQGLFSPASCISSLLFCSTGITLVARVHPYPALFYHRDYFAPASCISSFHFCTTGIISVSRIHPYFALLFHRDYFRRPVASLSCSFSPQGLLCPGQIRPPSLKASLPCQSIPSTSDLSYIMRPIEDAPGGAHFD